jgi:hypothetical protein
LGFPVALSVFGLTALVAAALAVPTFSAERVGRQAPRRGAESES